MSAPRHDCKTDDRKLAIDRPCSACSAGDSEMEYHDHCPPFREGFAAPLEPSAQNVIVEFMAKNPEVNGGLKALELYYAQKDGCKTHGDGHGKICVECVADALNAAAAVSKNLQEELANEKLIKLEWRELAERSQKAGTELVSLLRSSETRNVELEKEIAALRETK